MTNELCHEHSGCINDIANLKHDNAKQWQEIGRMNDKIDGIMTRLNVVLGSVVVACVMLLLNLVFRYVQ